MKNRKNKKTGKALEISETLYRRLFEAAKDGILILDADTGEITSVNPFMIELLGYSLEEFLGRKLWEISPFKDILANKTSFQELQAKEYIRYEDLPLETKSGQFIQVEFISNSYRVGNKTVIQCNIRDISDRKIIEKRLQDQILQSAKMATVGQLASGVAHEINNPLQAVQANLDNIELLLDEEEDLKKELPNIIWEMKVATDRCQQIVKGLLHFAKPSTHHQDKVYLEEILKEALMLTHPELDKEHVLIEKNLPPKIPTVQGNHRELMQVFVNFITNAVRAMSDSTKKSLRISAQVQNGKLLVSFQDTGRGISENVLPKIFEPFFTTSYEQAQGKMKGTGLGLSICQRIIEEHHGRIEVESEMGRGSTFTIILPC